MTDDLLTRLTDWEECDEGRINDARQEAADRLAALEAENARLREEARTAWERGREAAKALKGGE